MLIGQGVFYVQKMGIVFIFTITVYLFLKSFFFLHTIQLNTNNFKQIFFYL